MFEVCKMNKSNSVYFNEHNEVVGKGFDGKNKYEYVIFNQQQIEAIQLIIQKCSDTGLLQNR